MKISIIGTGIYGIALALSLKDNYHVMLWSENKELVTNFNNNHNLKPITDAFIPSNINVSNSIKDVLNDSNLIIFVTSIKYVRETLTNMLPYYKKNIPICIATKGIENNTGAFVSDIIKEILKTNNIAVLSGATFANDLINKNKAALSLASLNYSTTKLIKETFNNNITIQVINDIEGTELCGSIKNIFAIAAGILNGLNTSSSTRIVLISKALNSIKTILENLKCNPDTILSHAGIDDLILTCTSMESRNFKYGTLIGQNKNHEEFLKENTVEGYYSLLAIQDLFNKNDIHIPLINVIANIVIKKENPEILLDFLFN